MKSFTTKHFLTALKLLVLSTITITAPALGLFMICSSFAIGSIGRGLLFETFDPSGLAFSGKEVQSLSEAIYEAVFQKPALSDLVNIVTGIKAKQQIGFLGRLGLVGANGDTNTSCTPAISTEQITASDKLWDPGTVEDRFAQCWKDIKDTFFMWGTKNGIDLPDLSDTDYVNFIEDRIGDALWETVLRLTFFADKDAANVYDDGVITDGVDVKYFNMFDGIFKQIFALFTTSPTTDIAKNAGGSYSAQKFVAQDVTDKVIMGNFDEIIDNADARLRTYPGVAFYVTWSVYRQYLKELQQTGNIEAAYQLRQDGKRDLMYNGYPVIPVESWDRNIRAYEDDGTKWNKPHRIVFIPKENWAVGVDETASLSEMETWYERKDKTVYTDLLFRMDAKVIEDYMVAVGY